MKNSLILSIVADCIRWASSDNPSYNYLFTNSTDFIQWLEVTLFFWCQLAQWANLPLQTLMSFVDFLEVEIRTSLFRASLLILTGNISLFSLSTILLITRHSSSKWPSFPAEIFRTSFQLRIHRGSASVYVALLSGELTPPRTAN